MQPSNPETWLTLGEYDLKSNPRAAVGELRAAVYLNPESIAAQNAYVQALRAAPQASRVQRAQLRTGRAQNRLRRPLASRTRRASGSPPALVTVTSAKPKSASSSAEQLTRVEAQVVGARVEARLEGGAAQPRPQPRQRAVIGGADQQQTARAQHAAQLREPLGGVGHVLDRLAGPHHVEARVLERQRRFGLHQAQVQSGMTRSRRGAAPRRRRRRPRPRRLRVSARRRSDPRRSQCRARAGVGRHARRAPRRARAGRLRANARRPAGALRARPPTDCRGRRVRASRGKASAALERAMGRVRGRGSPIDASLCARARCKHRKQRGRSVAGLHT